MMYNFNLTVPRSFRLVYWSRASRACVATTRTAECYDIHMGSCVVNRAKCTYFLATNKTRLDSYASTYRCDSPANLLVQPRRWGTRLCQNAHPPTTNAMAESPVPFIIAETSWLPILEPFWYPAKEWGLTLCPIGEGQPAPLRRVAKNFPGDLCISLRT